MNVTNIIIIVLLIGLSAFFSASETAFSSANRIRLKNMAENGSKGAARALKILAAYDKALTTILIGNNIVNIATSSIATILAISVINLYFGNTAAERWGSFSATIATTLVVLVFGEICPKSLAKDHAEAFCISISGVISFLMILFTPFSLFFTALKKGMSKLFRKKDSVSVTEEELIAIIDEIEDEGVLEQQESKLVRSALEFDEITVDEIITPRVRIVAVDASDSAEEIYRKFLSEQYSRMPVCEKNTDKIIGVVNQKDFFRAFDEKGAELSVRDVMQETIFFPHLLKISAVLREMQKKKCHMSVVLDQHGGTLGIVTMEDLLEELVGEIWDESDEVKSPITVVSDRTFSVFGEVSLGNLRRFFEEREIEAKIESEAHTVAGWVLELFGSIPKSGSVVKIDDFTVTVLETAGRRINKVRIEFDSGGE